MRLPNKITIAKADGNGELKKVTRTAQHSVHPTGGSLRVFKQFAWLEVGSVKIVLSCPAHQRVTQAVGRFLPKQKRKTLSESKMTTEQASKTNRSVWVILGSSIPIILIVLGIIKAWMSEAHGIVDTTTEQAVFFGGLYLALPCGLLSIIVGINTLSKGLVNKKVAITGIVIGLLSIVIGLISWVWFFMISAFTKAFS